MPHPPKSKVFSSIKRPLFSLEAFQIRDLRRRWYLCTCDVQRFLGGRLGFFSHFELRLKTCGRGRAIGPVLSRGMALTQHRGLQTVTAMKKTTGCVPPEPDLSTRPQRWLPPPVVPLQHSDLRGVLLSAHALITSLDQSRLSPVAGRGGALQREPTAGGGVAKEARGDGRED